MARYTTAVDRPGQYLTRKRETVRIVSGRANEAGRMIWSGYITRQRSNGTLRKQWSEWGPFGLLNDSSDSTSNFDIVAYVGA